MDKHPDNVASLFGQRESLSPDWRLFFEKLGRDGLTDLGMRYHRGASYDPAADFAHVMLACLRSLGLAASYVSGYLLTQPPPGQARLVGSDASHAWVSVYVPGDGARGQWLDLDPPTAARPVTNTSCSPSAATIPTCHRSARHPGRGESPAARRGDGFPCLKSLPDANKERPR